MMLNLQDYLCSGCSLCANICPHSAIIMKPDTLGFLYPHIDKSKCYECGLCEKSCPSLNPITEVIHTTPYASRHIDISEVETSRSGASFIALANWILEQNGIVYGVGYGPNFYVQHKRASNKVELNEFKGSKYVQSDLNIVFCLINHLYVCKMKEGEMHASIPC